MTNDLFDRRQFLTASAGVGLVGIAGCSGSDDPTATDDAGGGQTGTPTPGESTDAATEPPTDEPTATATATETPAPTGEPADEVSDGVIETYADYVYVAERPDEFVGTEISCDGLDGDLRYYNRWGEEYQGFRALFDRGTRPFMIKTEESFMDTAQIEFTGTIERIGEIQKTPVIFVEDATVEHWRDD